MDSNAFSFLLKYSSPFSILVVTDDNQLIELNCPFKVKVIKQIRNLILEQTVEVTQVKLATNYKLVYIIDDKPYYYFYFTILLPF